MRTPLALLLSTSLALTWAAPSRAQQPDAATRATARQLGEDGMKSFDAGNCPDAVDKLMRAHALVHVPTLAFYAAKCLEKMGRLVDASERYRDATLDPVDPAAPATVKAAQADADKARKALLPRIPTVVITLQPPVPDALVLLDGQPLPPAMIGVKRPIDPGSHTLQVQRAGGVAQRPFSVQEKEEAAVALDVPMAGIPAGYAYGAPGGVPMVPGYTPVVMVRRSQGLFVGGIVLLTAGAVMGLSGAYLAATAVKTGPLGGPGITDTGQRNAGFALMGVGVLGLGGGIAMAVIGGRKVPAEVVPAVPVSFEPLLGPTSAGLRVRF
jgi:hypothetical protein